MKLISNHFNVFKYLQLKRIIIMKTTKFIVSAAFLFVSFYMVSCETPETESVELNEVETINSDELLKAASFTSDTTVVNSDEINGLYLMREEEKMARDVYAFFYAKFKVRTFGNITKSENQHSEAVLRLINYFGLTDPAVAAVGTFTNPEMQKLYDKFTTEALTANDALKTGAFIEEYDIADLKKLIAETENADIKLVYSNLLRGSTYHLKAFTSVLKFRGIIYTPTILSAEEYNSIISK